MTADSLFLTTISNLIPLLTAFWTFSPATTTGCPRDHRKNHVFLELRPLDIPFVDDDSEAVVDILVVISDERVPL
jgi:hypothetical protein